jgi:hypothetical protein
MQTVISVNRRDAKNSKCLIWCRLRETRLDSVGLLLGYLRRKPGRHKIITTSLYLESLHKEISEKFDQARQDVGVKTLAMTTEEKAEVLFAVALRKMR